jgi:hypothetical protein
MFTATAKKLFSGIVVGANCNSNLREICIEFLISNLAS